MRGGISCGRKRVFAQPHGRRAVTRRGYSRWLSGVSQPGNGRQCTEPAQRSDAVLAFAAGFGLDDVAPFIQSLRSVYPGRVVMVVGRDPTLRAYLKTHNVELETVVRRGFQWRPAAAVERFAAFAAILEGRIDIRDVVLADIAGGSFEADPFAHLNAPLQFYHEADGRPIAGRPGCLRELRRLAGNAIAERMADQAEITAARVAGSRSAVAHFCRTMLLLCAAGRSSRAGAPGAAQAACNLFYHLGLGGTASRAGFQHQTLPR